MPLSCSALWHRNTDEWTGISSACCAVFRSGVFIYRREMRRPGDLLKHLADSLGDSTELPTSRKLIHTTFTVTSLIAPMLL